MLRICHIGKYYHPFRGGIETHVRSLAQAQARSGNQVTVACINHLNEFGEDVWSSRTASTPHVCESDQDVEIVRFGKRATLARFDFCFGLSTWLKQQASKFDVLHLHVPNPAFCVALSRLKLKTPLVVTYHSDIVKQRWVRKPFSLVERYLFNRANAFIASSQNYADTSPVLTRYRDKTHAIPFGIDLEPFLHPSSTALQFSEKLRSLHRADGPLWLCVGRLVYYKGFEIAVRALEKCPGNLLVVGNGALRDALIDLAKRLGVHDRLHFLEGLADDELIGAYHAATALWFPSVVRSEAYGFVQIESMACGTPVINTSIPGSGVPWVSKHEVSGLTVPPFDSDQLAMAACKLITHDDLRTRLSLGAIQRAKLEFTLPLMENRIDTLYKSVGFQSHLDPRKRVSRNSAVLDSPMAGTE